MSNKLAIGFAFLGFTGYSRKDRKLALSVYKGLKRKVLAFLPSFSLKMGNLKSWYKICDTNSVTQVYLSNEVDRRKTRKDTNSVLYKLSVSEINKKLEAKDPTTLKAFQQRALKYYNFHKKRGVGELRLAMGLEHQFSKKALNSLIACVREVCPATKIVVNPVITASYRGKGDGDYLEIHEISDVRVPTESNLISGTDGYNICTNACSNIINGKTLSDSELRGLIKKWSKSDYFLLWEGSFNSLFGNSGALPEPKLRKSSLSKKCVNYIRKNIVDVILDDSAPDEVPVNEKPEGFGKLKNPFKTDGFVWKESDHGGLVVVFPPKFQQQFTSVYVEPSSGIFKKLRKRKLYYSGKANPYAGKMRQHWRHKKSAHKFWKNSVLTAVVKTKKGTKEIRWLIKDPSIRNGK